MKHFTKFTMSCKTVEDFNGEWTFIDTQDEMESLGMTPSGNEWIEFIIGHFDFPAEVDDIVTNDNVLSLKINVGGHEVTFIKK